MSKSLPLRIVFIIWSPNLDPPQPQPLPLNKQAFILFETLCYENIKIVDNILTSIIRAKRVLYLLSKYFTN